MRYIILDTETTGLEVHKGHRIIEIGCVEVVHRTISDPQTKGGSFHVYLNPDRDSDEGALRVHGLTREFLADKPLFSQVVDDFLDFIKDATVVIHNADFDTRFLNAELALLGLEPFHHYCHAVIDSLKVAKELFPGKRNSLDALCDRYQIQRGHRVLHGALLDSQLLAEVWLAMTRGQDSLFVAEEQESPSVTVAPATETKSSADIQTDSLLLFNPHAEDLSAHKNILEDIARTSKQPAIWQGLLTGA